MKLALLGVAGLLFSALAMAEEPLFVIARSTNANVVHYVANMTSDGFLDPTFVLD